ncbi:MAG: c-type cytochrome, partial [Pseudomonadota bacterium]|nr:c-type cytochrome [Pseudomonadota bacterium]
MIRLTASLSALLLMTSLSVAGPAQDYADNCQDCHGAGRLGGVGPALIPETLGRMCGPDLDAVIRDGRKATQMPAFADILGADQIEALAAFLKEPLSDVPNWTEKDIAASQVINEDYQPVEKPVWQSDPMNITLVVETGDHHVSVLDGDTFETLDRFATPFAVHGG